MLIPTWRQVLRAILVIGLMPALWWAWYSISNILAAAALLERASPITAAQTRSDWKNLLAITQFVAVTSGPAALIGAILIIGWMSESRRRG